jgi:hypothetical protein
LCGINGGARFHNFVDFRAQRYEKYLGFGSEGDVKLDATACWRNLTKHIQWELIIIFVPLHQSLEIEWTKKVHLE